MTSSLRLPESVHNGALFLANVTIIPEPGLRIDGFTHAAQNSLKELKLETGVGKPQIYNLLETT